MIKAPRCLHIAVIALTAHLVKLFYMFHRMDFQSGTPITNHDFLLYFARVLRSNEFYEISDRFWGYDPYNMAGYVAGPVHEVSTICLYWICHLLSGTVPLYMSYNGFIILSYSLFPLLIIATVVNLNGSRYQAWVAFLITTLMYGVIDYFTGNVITRGIYGFQLASFAALWQITVLWKWTHDKRGTDLVLLIIASILMIQLHPLAALIVIVPNMIAYSCAIKRLTLMHHLSILMAVLICVGANLFWIEPYLKFIDWKMPVNYFETQGWRGVFIFFTPFKSTYESVTGSLINLLLTLSALSTLFYTKINLHKKIFLGFSLLWLSILAFFGSALPLISELQPARNLIPFCLMVYIISSFTIAKKDKLNRVTVLVLLLVIVFFASSLSRFKAHGFTNTLPQFQNTFYEFLAEKGPLPGRLLFESDEEDVPILSDILAPLTGQPLLGGSNPGNILKARFTTFSGTYFDGRYVNDDPTIFGGSLASFTETEFFKYLDIYNICYIAARIPASTAVLDRFKRALSYRETVGQYRLYRVNRESDWFLKGEGQLSFHYDKIVIKKPSQGELVLKFHWIKTLTCANKGVTIKPLFIADDPVPFISIESIPKGLEELVIENSG